jgi:hypothetical protein
MIACRPAGHGRLCLLARRSLGSHADDLDLIRALSEVASAAADPATPLAALTGPMERALSLTGDTLSEAKVWTTAMRTALADHLEDLAGPPDASLLHEVEALCRILALEMDFGFLLDTEKKLLSIGFSVATNRWTPIATTFWPPRRGWPACLPSPRGMWKPGTGSALAVRRRPSGRARR